MTPRAAFLSGLFDSLWRSYRERVSYARVYEELVRAHGGVFRNDHVAFRALALQRPGSGIATISRPFEALGYEPAGLYRFPDKKLFSMHFAPPDPGLPKLFVSELRVWELSPRARRMILAATRRARPGLGDAELAALAGAAGLSAARRRALAARVIAHLSRPWPAPSARDVEALEPETQFGAWTLLHGHAVNHFTASIDAQDTPALAGIERTVAALRAAGVPMKPEIEGARGSKLRQSSTQPVTLPTPMRVGAKLVRRPWTYAYFELAERPLIGGARFEGFLGGQAANLFEMTRRA